MNPCCFIKYVPVLILILVSCKKTDPSEPIANNPPAPARISSSIYHRADIELMRYRFTNRTDTGIFSVTSSVYWHANLDVYSDTAQKIYVNGIYFGPGNFVSSSGWVYNHSFDNVTDSFVHSFDSCVLRILSPNNVDDLHFSSRLMPFYTAPVPFFVSLSNDLTLPTSATELPGADSAHIVILGENHNFDTTIVVDAGQVTISTNVLSSLFQPNSTTLSMLSIEGIAHHNVTEGGRSFYIVDRSYNSYEFRVQP